MNAKGDYSWEFSLATAIHGEDRNNERVVVKKITFNVCMWVWVYIARPGSIFSPRLFEKTDLWNQLILQPLPSCICSESSFQFSAINGP